MPSATPIGEGASGAPVSSAVSQDTKIVFEKIGDKIPSPSKGTPSPIRAHAASGELYMKSMMRINLLGPTTPMPNVTPAARVIK
jgi:hypothetical protein